MDSPIVDPFDRGIDTLYNMLRELEQTGGVDVMLDVLYTTVEAAMKDGRFPYLSILMRNLEPGYLTTDMILGWLTATLPAASKIDGRARFRKKAEQALRVRDNWSPDLLAGL